MNQNSIHILDNFISYWGTCLLLFLYDKIVHNKIFSGKKVYHLPDSLSKIFLIVLFNQAVVTFPIFFLIKDIYEGDGLFEISNLYKFPLVLLVHEFMFYYLHYFLHTPYLFTKIHHIHHRWRYPIAISTFYTHPLEQLFVNVLPIVISGLICNLNFSTMRFWHIFSILNSTILAHGGFDYKGRTSFHDIHHKNIKYNYGTIGFFDKLNKTDLNF